MKPSRGYQRLQQDNDKIKRDRDRGSLLMVIVCALVLWALWLYGGEDFIQWWVSL